MPQLEDNEIHEAAAFILTIYQNIGVNYTLLRLELILLKIAPILGPRIIKAAITTIATKTRIKAYSTRP